MPSSRWAHRAAVATMSAQLGVWAPFAQEQMQACSDSPDFFFALGDLLLDFAAEHTER